MCVCGMWIAAADPLPALDQSWVAKSGGDQVLEARRRIERFRKRCLEHRECTIRRMRHLSTTRFGELQLSLFPCRAANTTSN